MFKFFNRTLATVSLLALVIVALPIGFYLCLILIDSAILPNWPGNAQHHQYYSVYVEVDVDHQRHELSETFRCKYQPASLFLRFWPLTYQGADALQPTLIPSKRAMTHSLPSGAGLLIDLGDLCDRPKPSANLGRTSKETKTIAHPKIYWFDNIDSPTRVEGYIARDYAQTGVARVALIKIDKRSVTPSEFGPNRNDDWIEKAWLSDTWEGVYARTIDKTIWARDAVIAADLSALASRQSYDPQRRGHRPRFSFMQGRMWPLRLTNGVYVLSTDESQPSGLIIFYRLDEESFQSKSFRYNETTTSFRSLLSVNFDPETELLIQGFREHLKPIDLLSSP